MIRVLLVLLAPLFSELCYCINSGTKFQPVQALSISLNETFLNKNLKNSTVTIFQDLESSSNSLLNCQVIGSISEINLKDNSQLQFYFKYKLLSANSTLIIDIFAFNKNGLPFSKNLLIVMDFLVARYPIDYSIKIFNMTSYQEHIEYHTNKSYQLIFFLNGFNNMSLSGNITHSYQEPANMYTVHYMSCEGQSHNMGWKNHEYLLFTVAIVPMKNLIQKFKIDNQMFSVNYPQDQEYFYGIKGSTQPQFVGYFQDKSGGVSFHAQNLGKNLTYGIVFMPYPKAEFLDQRIHKYQRNMGVIVGFVCLGVVILISVGIFIKKKCQYKFFTKDLKLHEQQTQETTKSDIKSVVPHRNFKQRMSTVPEVDEAFQGTLKGSYNPKVDQMPSLVLNN